MRSLPLLCAAPVVRALLDGRQTMDRRPVKINPYDGAFYLLDGWPHRSLDGESNRIPGMEEPYRAPWRPGDVLYVRETWAFRADGPVVDVCYAADGGRKRFEPPDSWRPPIAGMRGEGWCSPLIMPKWAARIHLRVLSVRVGRVNAISEADAMAEGIRRVGGRYTNGDLTEHRDPVAAFAALWDRLYGAGSFERGDWCWVTTFERVEVPRG